ncbi:non-canonical purine NTP pyrophosphatase [Candidatus Gracilibacteria bacterium]|nr:non-canonical purine NTP pyrophosphatase [Candidatus Gracilibacteria bacterium]MCF7897116.1 non-canonical purine NTP pyrophosphatase [Candidatus Gracilibacteria bacterium]
MLSWLTESSSKIEAVMLSKLFLATANPSKIREISAALGDLALEIQTPADFEEFEMPTENGETFEKNAEIKAQFWLRKTGLPVLADDSGILVEALPDELGVQTVRFGAGANATDAEWLDYFLARMEGAQTRRAKFISVLALARPSEPTKFFRGEVEGEILTEAAAPLLPRIPLSSVFLADGATEVFAAMTTEEKSKFSHRGRAVKQLKMFLKKTPQIFKSQVSIYK